MAERDISWYEVTEMYQTHERSRRLRRAKQQQDEPVVNPVIARDALRYLCNRAGDKLIEFACGEYHIKHITRREGSRR